MQFVFTASDIIREQKAITRIAVNNIWYWMEFRHQILWHSF